MNRLVHRLTLMAVGVLGAALISSVVVQNWRDAHFVPIVKAQSDQGRGFITIETDRERPNAAVTIVDLTVGEMQVHAGRPFKSDDGWLKKLSISLENRTSKNIAFADLDVCFPETQAAGPIVCWGVQLGRIPDIVAYNGSGKPLHIDPDLKPLQFGPGKTIVVSFAADADGIKDFVDERQSFSEITKCIIRFGSFFFDDGMQWQAGMYSVPDPDHPGRGKNLETSYFPGVLPWNRKPNE